MATTYAKIKGEKVTVQEAATAQANFDLPTSFTFENWSHSQTDDEVVTEFLPGGAGYTVTGNKVFYPVISTKSLIGFVLPTPAEYVELGYINHSTDAFFNGETFTVATSGADEAKFLTSTENYINIAIAVAYTFLSGIGTRYKDAVEFGLINLSSITDSAAFSATSTCTGIKYYVKVIKNETFGGTTYPFSFRFFLKYDANLGKVKDLASADVGWFNQGDIIQFGQHLGGNAINSGTQPVGLSINLTAAKATYAALTPYYMIIHDFEGFSFIDPWVASEEYFTSFAFDGQTGLFTLSNPYDADNATVGDIIYRSTDGSTTNPHAELTRSRVTEIITGGALRLTSGLIESKRS